MNGGSCSVLLLVLDVVPRLERRAHPLADLPHDHRVEEVGRGCALGADHRSDRRIVDLDGLELLLEVGRHREVVAVPEDRVVRQDLGNDEEEGALEERRPLAVDLAEIPALVQELEELLHVVPEGLQPDLVQDAVDAECDLKDVGALTRTPVREETTDGLDVDRGGNQLALLGRLIPLDASAQGELVVMGQAVEPADGRDDVLLVAKVDVGAQLGPLVVEDLELLPLPILVVADGDQGADLRRCRVVAVLHDRHARRDALKAVDHEHGIEQLDAAVIHDVESTTTHVEHDIVHSAGPMGVLEVVHLLAGEDLTLVRRPLKCRQALGGEEATDDHLVVQLMDGSGC
jgi:hypothetical protein